MNNTLKKMLVNEKDPNIIPEDLVAEQEVSSQPIYTAEACKFINLNQLSLKPFNPN